MCYFTAEFLKLHTADITDEKHTYSQSVRIHLSPDEARPGEDTQSYLSAGVVHGAELRNYSSSQTTAALAGSQSH